MRIRPGVRMDKEPWNANGGFNDEFEGRPTESGCHEQEPVSGADVMIRGYRVVCEGPAVTFGVYGFRHK